MKLIKRLILATMWGLCALIAFTIVTNINDRVQLNNNDVDNYDSSVLNSDFVSLTNDDIQTLVIELNEKLIEDVVIEIVDDSLILKMDISKAIIDKVKNIAGDGLSGVLGMFVDQQVSVKVSKNQDELYVDYIKIKDLTIPKQLYQDYEDKINDLIISKMVDLSIDSYTISDDKINVYTSNKEKILDFIN